MNIIKAMRSFVAIAEGGSFVGAARVLGQSPPAVTRDVALLEEHLGCQLLIRTTRQLRLTPEGASYLDSARRILADINETEDELRGARGRVEGPIRITAPVLFGQQHVAPAALDFAQSHNGLHVALLFSDRMVDLVEEEVDIAVRLASLPDSTLRAIRIGTVRRVYCASPSYIEKFGAPVNEADLARHARIGVFGATAMPSRPLYDVTAGKPALASIATNDVATALLAAESGFGIVRALSYQVAGSVAAGKLRVVLPDHDPDPVPVSIVHAAGRRLPVRMRAMIDHLADALRPQLASEFAPHAYPLNPQR